MNEAPLISVAITTFNSSLTIIEALESVVNQTYTNFEILIFDDFSSDNTFEIMNKYLSTVNKDFKIYKSLYNTGGPATGRNWCINSANGKYICFLDADDFWKKNKLEKQILYINEKNIDVICTNAEVVNGLQFPVYSGLLSIWSQIRRNKIVLSSSMVKINFLKLNNILFNEKISYISVEDYDFFLNILLKRGKIFIYKEKLIYYNVISNSISHANYIKNEQSRLKVLCNMYTRNLLIKFFSRLIVLTYSIKLYIWNSKY
jgi:teichuronic acid biosynthesis glycosyltransferase TuaG